MASADRIGYTSSAPQYKYNPANFAPPPATQHHKTDSSYNGPVPIPKAYHAHQQQDRTSGNTQEAIWSPGLTGWAPPTPSTPLSPPPPYNSTDQQGQRQFDQGYFPRYPTSSSAYTQHFSPAGPISPPPEKNHVPPPQFSQFNRFSPVYPPTPQTPGLQQYPESPPTINQVVVERPHALKHYSEPSIAKQHSQWNQPPGLNTPQFAHLPPLEMKQGPYVQQVELSRLLSTPPAQHPQIQVGIDSTLTAAVHDLSLTTSEPAVVSAQHQDDLKTGTATRFFGNMLAVRGARAVCSTVRTTATLPFYLSPWGDNNPITLPNVRKRDVALAGVMHLGVGELAPAALDVVETVVKTGVTWTAEQAVDTAHHKISNAKPHKIARQGHVTSLTIRIRHKLLGEDAEVQLFGRKETLNKSACAKGWFCPYLYASGRTLYLERSSDFSFAQLYGPGLVADSSVAPTLIASIPSQDTRIIAACPYRSLCPTYPRFRRMAIFLLGISPYRTATAWSQSKIPNEARLTFHVLTHVPTIVLPVSEQAPVCAWSPWTLQQMLYGGDGYDTDKHYYEILHYLETIVDESLMDNHMKPNWRHVVGNGLRSLFEAVQQMRLQIGAIEKVNNYSLDRAGVVIFRY